MSIGKIYNFSNYEYLNPSQNKYGNLELTDYPTIQVVTTSELKSQLRIDNSDEDTLLGTYISAATQMAENYCNRHFINATYKLKFNSLPSKFSLYYPDCHTFSLWAKVTENSYSQEDAANYYVNTDVNPNICNIHEKSLTPMSFDSMEKDTDSLWYLGFSTGYGAGAANVPDAIKQAIKLIASDMYYFREDRKRSFPMASEILLQPYKCYL